MTLAKLTTLIGFVFALSACGGSGGSSSGASQSNNTPQPSPVIDNSGLVFGDAINSDWGHFSAFDWSNVEFKGKSYENGQTTNIVQWKTVEVSAPEHKSVAEVNYTVKDNSWAQFEISTNAPKDLSAYETGKLSFDINVLDWGNTYNNLTNMGSFEIRTECGWPCASHAFILNLRNTNVWTHVEIPIAEMVTDGLDLTKIDRAFIIMPIAANQNGLRMQLDNIRWSKGNTPAVKKKIVYVEHFNTRENNTGWQSVSVNNIPSNVSINAGLEIIPSSTGAPGRFFDALVEKTLAAPLNLTNKNIAFQVKPNETIMGPGALQVIATDVNFRQAISGFININQFTANVWNRISFNASSGFSADANFDARNVRTLSIKFNSFSTPHTNNTTWGAITVDEIIITE